MNESVIDTHVHLWELDRLPYTWLDSFPILNQDHGLSQYREATEEADVDAMVFVECTESFDDDVSKREVQWVHSLAEQEDRLKAIVAHASLEKGAGAEGHLDWLAEQPLVTGVRRIVQDEDPDFLTRPDFMEGVQLLADYDFTFDLTVQSHQLDTAVELVDGCPGVQFVLDHLGKPQIREGEWTAWADAIITLSDRENVVCKLSGVLTEADLDDWTYDDVAPYLEHAVKCFGRNRILFGGDWPVLRLAADYSTWMDVVHRFVEEELVAGRERLFRKNAKRIYLG